MASGLEALAVRALECGEATGQRPRGHRADLSARLVEDLNRAALVISQLADNN